MPGRIALIVLFFSLFTILGHDLFALTRQADTTFIEADSMFSYDDLEFEELIGTDEADTTVTDNTEIEHATVAAMGEGEEKTLWETFVAGFLHGFLALLMPCIFPMLPLTVSFFTKRAGSRSKGIGQALIYGVSIIVIYVTLGMFVTIIFGSDALNSLSTNGFFNFLFFLLLITFAASFLGAFEITLPSSFVNKIDAKSDQGGLIGIFFMAFSLALVSFSCTGPLIGNLLVIAASKGERLGPAVGMFGFSLALAIPFALFALFPSLLKSLPKSGGWLNSVKVVLGFLELALALKFLSNVDLAYHWNWLDREVFLALWIVIFALLGLYLIGKIKFAHDSEVQYLSVTRTFMAIAVFAFTMYLIPGMWGAPLKAVSAFLPPSATQDFDLSAGLMTNEAPVHENVVKKYAEIFHERGTPKGFDPFYDFDQALEVAKTENKPVLIDFTGWNCVNCRKMEANVWTDPKVKSLLNNEFIMAELFVDDKTDLPEEEQYTSTYSGKKIKTIGNKMSDFQAATFNSNSQPLYVIVDTDGKVLVPPQGANYDVQNYIDFLQSGVAAFKKLPPSNSNTD